MSKRRIDVFISSTSYDLPDHRAKVAEILNRLQLQPLGMEYWNVTGEDPVALCKKHVSEAEIFVGIYAYRYGWQPPNYGGKSITEMEYDWAGEVIRDGKPIPRLCFIMHEDHPIKAGMVQADRQNELNAFKARVKAIHAGFFKSVDDLGMQVIGALTEALKNFPDGPPFPCHRIPQPPKSTPFSLRSCRRRENSCRVIASCPPHIFAFCARLR
jgi:uncharacterized protein DUF4062